MKSMSYGWIIGWGSTERMVYMIHVILVIAGGRNMADQAISITGVTDVSTRRIMLSNSSITGQE